MNINPHWIIDFFAGGVGLGLGSVLAVVLSWDRNRSIFLAIIHAFFSWIYVIWFAITRHSRPPSY
jgi:hypothetical protein